MQSPINANKFHQLQINPHNKSPTTAGNAKLRIGHLRPVLAPSTASSIAGRMRCLNWGWRCQYGDWRSRNTAPLQQPHNCPPTHSVLIKSAQQNINNRRERQSPYWPLQARSRPSTGRCSRTQAVFILGIKMPIRRNDDTPHTHHVLLIPHNKSPTTAGNANLRIGPFRPVPAPGRGGVAERKRCGDKDANTEE